MQKQSAMQPHDSHGDEPVIQPLNHFCTERLTAGANESARSTLVLRCVCVCVCVCVCSRPHEATRPSRPSPPAALTLSFCSSSLSFGSETAPRDKTRGAFRAQGKKPRHRRLTRADLNATLSIYIPSGVKTRPRSGASECRNVALQLELDEETITKHSFRFITWKSLRERERERARERGRLQEIAEP